MPGRPARPALPDLTVRTRRATVGHQSAKRPGARGAGPPQTVSGEADVQAYNTSFANYTLYKESEAAAGYTVYPIPGILGSQLAFGFNLNHEDPVLRARTSL